MAEQQSVQMADQRRVTPLLAETQAKGSTSFCLIVDDEKGIRTLIARSLRNYLVMTEECSDAQSALEALRLRTPDLIFLDISLERSDAIEVIRGLGELKYRGAVQLMSGRDLNLLEEIKRVGEKYELRMLTVMQKPFRVDVLSGILRDAGIAQKPPLSSDARVGLFEALCAGWVDLCYQPKFDLRTQKMVGAEGLVRVIHPTRGMLPPQKILVEADEASLLALTECALLNAMKDWDAFDHAGNALRLSINVPMIALRKLSIAAMVRDNRPKATRWPGLILEVSEDQILSDVSFAHEIATHLRIYGLHLAIGRFGSGSTSLESLREFPFVELKINNGFVSGCADNPNHHMLCKAVIDLAHRLGRHAVAEGIERPEDLKALAEMGCDFGQGPALGRAIPKEQLTALIVQQVKNRRGY